MTEPDRSCPLCNSSKLSHFLEDSKRSYQQCQLCKLVSVPPRFFLTAEAEKAEYDLHENSADDLGYRKFLGRMFKPMLAQLSGSNLHGLDFGSGPGPTLSVMFAEAGHPVSLYDRFYAPDIQTLNQQYDFITATEVVEHLHHPAKELNRLWSCLRPGGYLGIMTKRVHDAAAFSTWHYKNDPTHVCFFHEQTFAWLATQWDAGLTLFGKDVVIFEKSAAPID